MFNGELLSERARLTPDRTALVSVETGERLTYRQLDARAMTAARAMLDAGLRSGDRLGILAFNCIEFITAFFGAWKADLIAVPLSTRATAHELRQVADDCDMRMVLFGTEFAATAAGLGRESHPLGIVRTSTDREIPATAGDDDTIQCLLYTSGTTGKPKGVMIPRRQLLWNGYNTAVNWSLREDDVSSVYTPLYHAGGLAAFLIPIFTAGGTIVLHKGFDPSEVWRVLQEERCTVVLGVPTIYKLLMDAPEFATADLSHVRWFISGGAPLPQYIIEAYQKRGVVMKQGYGMTEVGVNCFSMTVEESFRKPGSIGRPMLFTAMRIVDGEGQDVAQGEVGELWIRGPHVSSGYWKNPQATAASYGDDGWFRTGDLARQDDEGFFYIAGRKKEMFISGGVNVYPAEIEGELVAHAQVTDAAVIAVADETWGEVPVAFVVAKDVSSDDLSSYLTLRIAKYKIPRRFVFVDALPRTPYGKVVKDDLRRMLDASDGQERVNA